MKGTSFLLAAYFLYSLATSTAYSVASNLNVTPKTPGNTRSVQSAPASKPRFITLFEGTVCIWS